MASSDPSCHTIVFESSSDYPSSQELRSALEKGSDEVKLETLRKIIVSTINGNHQASVFSISLRKSRVEGKGDFCLADIDNAHHTICYAISEQATQEAVALLLGSLSEVWREWEA